MLDPTPHPQQKTQVVFERAAALGLKAPSEPTFALMTAMYLLASEGLGARELTPSVKHETFRLVKSQYKKFLQSMASRSLQPLFRAGSSVQS